MKALFVFLLLLVAGRGMSQRTFYVTAAYEHWAIIKNDTAVFRKKERFPVEVLERSPLHSNVVDDRITITLSERREYRIMDTQGKVYQKGTLPQGSSTINAISLPRGVLLFSLDSKTYKFIKR